MLHASTQFCFFFFWTAVRSCACLLALVKVHSAPAQLCSWNTPAYTSISQELNLGSKLQHLELRPPSACAADTMCMLWSNRISREETHHKLMSKTSIQPSFLGLLNCHRGMQKSDPGTPCTYPRYFIACADAAFHAHANFISTTTKFLFILWCAEVCLRFTDSGSYITHYPAQMHGWRAHAYRPRDACVAIFFWQVHVMVQGWWHHVRSLTYSISVNFFWL